METASMSSSSTGTSGAVSVAVSQGGSSSKNQNQNQQVNKLPVLKGLKKKIPHRAQSFTTQSQTSRSSVGNSTKQGITTKRSMQSTEFQPQVLVKDENGKDVTPISLLPLKRSVLEQHTILMNSGSPLSTGSDDFERSSAFSVGKSLFSWSSKNSHSGRGSGSSTPTMDPVGNASPSPRQPTPPEEAKSVAAIKPSLQIFEEKELVLNAIELDKTVNLFLEETSTIWLLDIPGSIVEKDSPAAAEVIFQNDSYRQTLNRKKTQNESFMERGVQTLNFPPKSKEVQIAPPKTKEIACSATEWDIYDSFNTNNEEVSILQNLTEHANRHDTADKELLEELDKEPGSWIEFDANAEIDKDKKLDGVSASSQQLLQSLSITERIIIQNSFYGKQQLYRGFVDVPQLAMEGSLSATGSKPALHLLWTYTCSLAKNRNVSCLTWNPQIKDILAVGYGQFEYTKQSEDGLVLCWTLKNPKFPERIIRTRTGVTALSFSAAHSNLLAVGLYDGTVAIYDLRKAKAGVVDTPVLDSIQTDFKFKHLDPIWQLQWVDRDDETGQSLVSLSSDGRVVQWSIKKGLEHKELMKLKRVANQAILDKKTESFVARQAAGLCLDFHRSDNNIYIVGTEDGNIHRCSCSYNEQYLETYTGHSGPVYRIKWSPFYPNLFLSASADWTAKLWVEDQTEAPVLSFESSYVADVCWSPTHPSVFVSITGNNTLDIWDLEVSTLDAVLSYPLSVTASCVAFSENSPVVVVGDQKGVVSVYRHTHLSSSSSSNNNKSLTDIINKIKNQSGSSSGSAPPPPTPPPQPITSPS